MEWFGTARVRLGLSVDRALLYVTGGAAFASSRASFNVFIPAAAPPLNASASLNADFGWTVGGGVEFAFSDAWSAKVEYLYYDLGTESGTINYAYGAGQNSSLTGRVRHDGHIVRAGINYRFGAPAARPVVAAY